MEEDADFLDLDKELPADKDCQDYIQQFAVEEYNFENYVTGKYYDNVPLEQNPEAYLDVLARQSLRSKKKPKKEKEIIPHNGGNDVTDKDVEDFKLDNDSVIEYFTTQDITDKHHRETTGDSSGTGVHKRGKSATKKVSFRDEHITREPNGTKSSHLEYIFAEEDDNHSRFIRSVQGNCRDKATKDKANAKPRYKSKMETEPSQRPKSVTTQGIIQHCEEIERSYVTSPKDRKHKARGKPYSSTSVGSAKNKRFKFPSLERFKGKKDKDNHDIIMAYGSPSVGGQLYEQDEISTAPHPGFVGRTMQSYKPNDVQGDKPISSSVTQLVPNHKSKPLIDTHMHPCARSRIYSQDSPTSASSNSYDGDLTISISSSISMEEFDHPSDSPVQGFHDKVPRAGILRGTKNKDNNSENMEPTMNQLQITTDGLRHAAKPNARGVNMVEYVTSNPDESLSIDVVDVDEEETGISGLVLRAARTGNLQGLMHTLPQISEEECLHIQDHHGNNMLHLSAAGGHMSCLEYLSEQFPALLLEENRSKLCPAGAAIKHGQIEILDWMLDNVPTMTEQHPLAFKQSLIHCAAKFGQDGCLQLLLAKMVSDGGSGHIADQSGNTAAHLAAKYGHLTCLQTLMEHEASDIGVVKENHLGHTPCQYADFHNHRQCVSYLSIADSCLKLAADVIKLQQELEGVKKVNEALISHLTESLSIGNHLAGLGERGGEFYAKSQQIRHDFVDLTDNLFRQIQDLSAENSALRQHLNGGVKSPHQQQDLADLARRTAILRRQSEELGDFADYRSNQQCLLKLKEVEQQWMNEKMDTVSDGRDFSNKARKLVREEINKYKEKLREDRESFRKSKDTSSHSTWLPHKHKVENTRSSLLIITNDSDVQNNSTNTESASITESPTIEMDSALGGDILSPCKINNAKTGKTPSVLDGDNNSVTDMVGHGSISSLSENEKRWYQDKQTHVLDISGPGFTSDRVSMTEMQNGARRNDNMAIKDDVSTEDDPKCDSDIKSTSTDTTIYLTPLDESSKFYDEYSGKYARQLLVDIEEGFSPDDALARVEDTEEVTRLDRVAQHINSINQAQESQANLIETVSASHSHNTSVDLAIDRSLKDLDECRESNTDEPKVSSERHNECNQATPGPSQHSHSRGKKSAKSSDVSSSSLKSNRRKNGAISNDSLVIEELPSMGPRGLRDFDSWMPSRPSKSKKQKDHSSIKTLELSETDFHETYDRPIISADEDTKTLMCLPSEHDGPAAQIDNLKNMVNLGSDLRRIRFQRKLSVIEEDSVQNDTSEEQTADPSEAQKNSKTEDADSSVGFDSKTNGVKQQKQLTKRKKEERPWYEMSDDEEIVSWQRGKTSVSTDDHFTLF